MKKYKNTNFYEWKYHKNHNHIILTNFSGSNNFSSLKKFEGISTTVFISNIYLSRVCRTLTKKYLLIDMFFNWQ